MNEEKEMTDQELQEYIDSIRIESFADYTSKANETLSLKFSTENVSAITLHGIIGIATEAGEVLEAVYEEKKPHIGVTEKYSIDPYNLKEELGDLMWYIACVAKDNNFILQDLIDHAGDHAADVYNKRNSHDYLMDYVVKISIRASHLLDIAKKDLFYKDNGLNDQGSQKIKINNGLIGIICEICDICSLYGWSLKDEVCLVNIKKLLKRYKRKFSTEAALKRNLEGEREILEGK